MFKCLGLHSGQKAPSYSSVRLWIMRNGYSKLNEEILENGTWVILGDVTVDIGKVKALVTVGVDLDKLEERGEYTISLEDLHIIGIHPTESSTGEFAYKAFDEAKERLGGTSLLAAFIIDQGSDVTKGGKILNEANEKTKFIHDLSHKLALLLEKELEEDPMWDKYTSQLTTTGQLVHQTELAALKPPKLRSKARFMNVARYVAWQDKISTNKKAGNLNSIPEDRYEQYFGWLPKFEPSLNIWIPKIRLIERVKEVIRTNGLSEASYDYLLEEIAQMPLEKDLTPFIETVFDTIYEEVEKLDDGQTLPAFTEALESLFGSYKYHASQGGHGITGNILTLGTLVGKPQTAKEIQKVMEKTPVKKVLEWVREKVGKTVGSLRSEFFKKQRTEFDSQPVEVPVG